MQQEVGGRGMDIQSILANKSVDQIHSPMDEEHLKAGRALYDSILPPGKSAALKNDDIVPDTGSKPDAGSKPIANGDEERELQDGIRMIRENPENFSKVVDWEWDYMDFDKDGFLSKPELSYFLAKSGLTAQERAIGRVLISKHDTVRNFYDQENKEDYHSDPLSGVPPIIERDKTEGISHDDIYVMAKALDKNASHDPVRRDNWHILPYAAFGVVVGGGGWALTSIAHGFPVAVTVVSTLAMGAFLGIFTASQSGKYFHSPKNYYEQKRQSIQTMLDGR